MSAAQCIWKKSTMWHYTGLRKVKGNGEADSLDKKGASHPRPNQNRSVELPYYTGKILKKESLEKNTKKMRRRVLIRS